MSGGDIDKQSQRFFDGHIQHLRNIIAAIFHREGLFLESSSAADGTAHFDLRQEMHLDGQRARAFAALTASARDVEREMTRGDLILFGFGRGGKGFTDGCEGVRVSRGVRARNAPKVLLVDGDDLVDVLPAGDGVVLARNFLGMIQALMRGKVEDVEDER